MALDPKVQRRYCGVESTQESNRRRDETDELSLVGVCRIHSIPWSVWGFSIIEGLTHDFIRMAAVQDSRPP